jgi:hypothetical protein
MQYRVLVPLLKDRWIDGGEFVNLLNIPADRTVLRRSEKFLHKRGRRYPALENNDSQLSDPLEPVTKRN